MEGAPAECALPTEERPSRVAEFDPASALLILADPAAPSWWLRGRHRPWPPDDPLKSQP